MNYVWPVIFSSLSCIAFASAPQGFKVISGEAMAPMVDAQGVITISSGKQAVIHWDAFSIGKDIRVRFAQADATSAILNRVVGFSESRIDGSLLSNGKVFLINKNGVVVGPHGRIETAGFVASTLDIINEDFLKGEELLFKGDSVKKVVNLGTIVASEGDVVLIGQNVDNQGSIQAPQGHVLFGCGQEILLQPKGEERIFIRLPVSTPEEQESSALEHSGTIETLVAEFKSGVTPFAKAIKSSGKIDALAIHEEGGKVFLIAENGRADISGQIVAKQGEHGGNIQLLGKEVYLLEGAEIEASGDKGAGEILIGGDYQGNNPKVLNADVTFVAENAIIRANAQTEGNGGKVIIWGGEATGYFGLVEARGGPVAGDGGLIEVSGGHLEFKGLADTSAPKGNFGQLLLDPYDITISNSPDSCSSCPTNCFSPSGDYKPCCTPGTENLSVTTLTNLLATSNVTIATSGCSSSTGTGIITVVDDIIWSSTSNLTLDAVEDLDINGDVIGNGSIFLSSGGNLNINGLVIGETSVVLTSAEDCNITEFIESSGPVNASISGSCTISSAGFLSDGDTDWTIGGSLTMNIGSIFVDSGSLSLTVGSNLSMTDSSSINNYTDDILILVGNSASLSSSSITTINPDGPGGGNITLVVDYAHPSSVGRGGLTTDSMSEITVAANMATRLFTAARNENRISSATILGNGSPPTTFTPGTLYVNTATEMWDVFYSNSTSLLGGFPYTFFYKQSAPPPPPPPAPPAVRAAAITHVAVTNTVITNLFSFSPSYDIVTRNLYEGNGQAIPLTQNENKNAFNDSMSEKHCP